jgi:methylenetetrahydrofolate reductase (NADPH)
MFSVEVFPPKTEQGLQRLEHELTRLAGLRPSYVSVTCPAGAGASERTHRTVAWIRERLGDGADVAPHVIGVGATRAGIRTTLSGYRALGVRRLVVIRGDVPPGRSRTRAT